MQTELTIRVLVDYDTQGHPGATASADFFIGMLETMRDLTIKRSLGPIN